MQKYLYILILLLIGISCSEKEKTLEASPNVLLSVRMNIPIVEMELEDQEQKKVLISAISKQLMEDCLLFTEGHIYEMIKGAKNTVDVYKSLKDFKKDSKLRSGRYMFSDNEMKVTYIMDNEERSFDIDGHAASIFYNHFTHNSGTGEYHIVEASKVFCLNDDYTARFQEEYPNALIQKVIIKTDVMIIRNLETFK